MKEYTINTEDGLALYSQIWDTSSPAKAIVAIIHGLGEHSGRYHDLAMFLNHHNISVAGLDLRGHGISEGIRGHAPSYDAIMDDIDSFLQLLNQEFTGIPLFLMGHSLGGNLVLTYLNKRQAVTKAIITAPLLALPEGPGLIKKLVGNLLYNWLPEFTMASGLDATKLSRDINIVKAYKNDPLVHDRISARLGIDFLRFGEWLQSQIIPPAIQTLIMQGSADMIVDPIAVRKFIKNQNGNTTFKEWKGFYHELHNEPTKEDIYNYLVQWITNHL